MRQREAAKAEMSLQSNPRLKAGVTKCTTHCILYSNCKDAVEKQQNIRIRYMLASNCKREYGYLTCAFILICTYSLRICNPRL